MKNEFRNLNDVVRRVSRLLCKLTLQTALLQTRIRRLQRLASFGEFTLQFLNAISAIDFIEYFDVVYHLTSFRLKHSAVIKTRVHGRESLSVPSVYHVWQGADFQEREVWDLMGVQFEGHPNMKRIMLWEGYEGHPLRKDFL